MSIGNIGGEGTAINGVLLIIGVGVGSGVGYGLGAGGVGGGGAGTSTISKIHSKIVVLKE